MFNFSRTLLLVFALATRALGAEPPLHRSMSPVFPADVRFGDANELFILGSPLGGLTTGRSSSLVWLDNATNTWRQFRRNSQVVLNHAEIEMTIADVSQDGRTVLLRHSLQGPDPSEQLRLPVGSAVRAERPEVFSFWDVHSGSLLRMLSRSENDEANLIRFLPDGKHLVIWGTKYTQGPTMERVKPDVRQPLKQSDFRRLTIAGQREFGVDLYSVETGGLIKELASTETMGECLGISSDGAWIVVSGGTAGRRDKQEMRLIEVATGNQSLLQDGPWRNLGPMSARERGVGHAEFTVDSKLLWTPKRWWDITARKVVHEPWMKKISEEFAARNTLSTAGTTHNLTGGPRPPSRYFSPDGRLFFLPGTRLPEAIEMTSGRLFAVSNKLKGHSSAIENWAFSADMKYLVTLSGDGELIKWDLTHKDVDWPK